ncbi:hypothetical protein [Streptomyces sp. ODS28]
MAVRAALAALGLAVLAVLGATAASTASADTLAPPALDAHASDYHRVL